MTVRVEHVPPISRKTPSIDLLTRSALLNPFLKVSDFSVLKVDGNVTNAHEHKFLT